MRDVADVIDGIKETTSISRYNGKNGIGLMLKKQGDANAVDVSKLVREKFKSIEKENSDSDVTFIIADDSTDNTIAAVNSVVFHLILAVVLVSLVMLLFLRSFRNSLIVIVAIPTSLVTAFAVMWLLGYTLNLMTLLAMSLIIGILVDQVGWLYWKIFKSIWMGKDKRMHPWMVEWKSDLLHCPSHWLMLWCFYQYCFCKYLLLTCSNSFRL